MKILYLILFTVTLLVSVIQAQSTTAWYVDPTRSGAGTYDGRSWATAFRYPDNYDYWENDRDDGLDWALVQPGDTIYLSGGTDSLIWSPNALYQQSVNPSGISIGVSPNATRSYSFLGDPPYDNPVIVTKGKDVGHNGKVIFDLDSNDDQSRAVSIMGLVNVVFTDLTFRNTRDPVVDVGSSVIQIGASQAVIDSMIVFDNCTFYTRGAGGTFGIATTKMTLRNSTVSVPYNVLVNGQDPFGLSSGHGGHTFDNNIIIVRNGYEIENGNITGVGVTVTDTSLTDVVLNMMTNYHTNNSVWVNGYYLQLTGNSNNTFYGPEWVFEEYSPTDSSAVVITDTSLSDVKGESWNSNILVGALIICAGDTLVITRNGGTSHFGSAGWYPATPSSGRRYKIVGAGAPGGDSLKWFMGGPHKDMMQFSNIGMGADTVIGGASNQPRLPITISNNLILDPVPLGTGWNALIYNYGWSYTPPIEFRIYNNIIVSAKEKTRPGALVLGRLDNNRKNTLKVLNNTFITRTGTLTEWSVDTLIYKNNLMICDTNLTINYNLTLGHNLTQINYNLISEQGGFTAGEQFATFGNEYTLSVWQGTYGYDVNSVIADSDTITFVDKFGETKESYYTESGVGLAENLWDEYPFLQTDAVGNPRPQSGSWDIGALDYQNGVVVDSTPSNVVFITDYLNAELNTAYTGHIQDLIDFDSGYVHINRGWYNVDGQLPWKNASQWTMVYPTNDIYVRDTSSTEHYITKQIVVTVGNASDTWTLRTKTTPSNKPKIVKTSNGQSWIGGNGVPIRMRTSPYIPPPGEPDNTPPSPPTSFLATNSGSTSQFLCTWNNPIANDLYSIQIYEGAVNDTAQMSLVATVLYPNNSYLRTGRTANTTYWCAVKAVDDSGNVSYFSNTDDVTTAVSDTGQPLQNLKLAYLTQSFASHLYDHSGVGDPGTTTVPTQVDSYNVNNDLTGYNAASVTRIYPDYPASGDMMWNWTQVFWDGTLWGNTSPHEYIVDDYLTDTTYSIIQVTFGPANAGINTDLGWFWPWVVSEAYDTVNWQNSHTYGIFKWHIRKVLTVMEQYPDKFFVLWTVPPVCYTGCGGGIGGDGERQYHFNTWMLDTLGTGLDSYGAFPSNVLIYDVFTLLQVDYKYNPDYDDAPDDGHPNEVAASIFAPDYVQKVFDGARAYRRPD